MRVDPITLEIVRGAVSSIILQMEGLVERIQAAVAARIIAPVLA